MAKKSIREKIRLDVKQMKNFPKDFVKKGVALCPAPKGYQNILSQPIILGEFCKFCCTEYSIENILGLIALYDYKKYPTFDKAHFI